MGRAERSFVWNGTQEESPGEEGEELEEGSQPKKRRKEEEDRAVETVAAAGRQFDNRVTNRISFLFCLSWFPD